MVRGRVMKMRRMRRSKFSVRLSKEEVLNTWELSLQSIPLVQTCAIYTLYTDKVTLYTTVPVIVFVFVYLCICVFVLNTWEVSLQSIQTVQTF